MDPSELVSLGKALEALGPYGLLGAVIVAVRRVYRDLKAVNERVVALTEQQTAVMARVDASLLALRDAILLTNGRQVPGGYHPPPAPHSPAAAGNGAAPAPRLPPPPRYPRT